MLCSFHRQQLLPTQAAAASSMHSPLANGSVLLQGSMATRGLKKIRESGDGRRAVGGEEGEEGWKVGVENGEIEENRGGEE